MCGPGQPIHDVSLLLSGANQHLACGADVDELLEQAADGYAGQFTGHQQDCLYCQAALVSSAGSGPRCAASPQSRSPCPPR